jgi:SAM-dependent methyltransferase
MGGRSAKDLQIEYYDDHVIDPEFEIARPHGQPKLYEYLMEFKFNRATHLMTSPLLGCTVLDICCGSGMDAEMLARSGARVAAVDISSGCLDRARARARRYGVTYQLVRADAEHLPFADRSFDYCFVHDGLHHLADPDLAVGEMARVARRGLVITEPADALVTRLPIRLGLMKPFEDAGNYVKRMHPRRLELSCRALGFDRIRTSRYLVKYGHPPSARWRLFDSPLLFSVAKVAFLAIGDGVMGRWGNKLAFVAERTSSTTETLSSGALSSSPSPPSGLKVQGSPQWRVMG